MSVPWVIVGLVPPTAAARLHVAGLAVERNLATQLSASFQALLVSRQQALGLWPPRESAEEREARLREQRGQRALEAARAIQQRRKANAARDAALRARWLRLPVWKRNDTLQAEVSTRGLPTWREAEIRCAVFIQALGLTGVKVAPPSQDDGVDVVADGVVAQVKHQSAPVGGPVIQRLVGASVPTRSTGLCFTMTGYTRQAQQFAVRSSICLFTYDKDWVFTAVNEHAKALLLSTEL